ncbi:hypothetical protein [Marinilabilia salmonicolor]|uniref:hypothetical protein n=1 Tax=Marinilabilia salmonicolor TaxID=989 RepID=UPI0012F6F0B7|nr:hypothetical protein [Marinilabilia salmonicolor]
MKKDLEKRETMRYLCTRFARETKGSERNSRAVFFEKQPTRSALEKKTKIILAEKIIYFIFALAFEKKRGAKRGCHEEIESEEGLEKERLRKVFVLNNN